jgi:hypothetical protein
MPTLDVAMPLALLSVVTAALFLNGKVEKKLKATVEEKEFRKRDILLLVVAMAIIISVIAVSSIFSPDGLFTNVFTTFFMIAYSSLLFTFSYILSDGKKKKAQIISVCLGVASLIFAAVSLLGPVSDGYTIFRFTAFIGLAVFCFGALILDQKRGSETKERWYVAAQPAALFVLLFAFFNVFYSGGVRLWFPLLLDAFAFTFALLIILYLSSLFTWKTVIMFAGMLTVLDVILVFSGPMIAAAETFTGAGLPVLVWLPKIPLIVTETGAIQLGGLGLGDYFFAGILAIQTLKKFGKRTALISAVVMSFAFGVWELFLPEIGQFFNIRGFPATVCIITGWLPLIAVALFYQKRKLQQNPPNTPDSLPNENTEKL